jgi:uroporphyrinogen-III synthase
MANEPSNQAFSTSFTPKTAVRTVLISQPPPTTEKSPYHELAKKFDLQIDFRPFIEIRPVTAREFRKQKINILDHTAIIFTSKNAVDHFFALAKVLRVEVPEEMKYFCVSEQTANYLQRYIVLRKRKVFVGERTSQDLQRLFIKHKKEKYLFPCSDIRKDDISEFMKANNIALTEAVIYSTVPSDLKDVEIGKYDLLAFFSPSGVKSLLHNFPNFEQKNTRIAAFGPTTAQAVRDLNLRLDIEAPMPNAPSMTGAIEVYLQSFYAGK